MFAVGEAFNLANSFSEPSAPPVQLSLVAFHSKEPLTVAPPVASETKSPALPAAPP